MNKTLDLKNALTELFRSGATSEYDVNDMEGLLEGINFYALRQALADQMETVYEYRLTSEVGTQMEYHGEEMFDDSAVLLCVDKVGSAADVANYDRSLELWLLADMTFAVTSCFRASFHDGAVISEYRTELFGDWDEEGMDIDFLNLAETLERITRNSGN